MKRIPVALLAATVFFIIAPRAHACQLVCMLTNAVYQGDLGGLAGADAKCDAEFKGFKFARSATILANISGTATVDAEVVTVGDFGSSGRTPLSGLPVGMASNPKGVTLASGTSGSTSSLTGAWVNSGSANCSGWTLSGGGNGTVTGGDTTGQFCGSNNRLLCCNI